MIFQSLAPITVLDDLRLLFNFKIDSANPFVLILSGQPQIRNKLAGGVNDIFTPSALTAIHTISGGFLRTINNIAVASLIDLKDEFWNTEMPIRELGVADGVTVASAFYVLKDKINI